MKRFITIVLLISFFAGSMSGCQSMGRVTGKAVKGTKKAVHKLETMPDQFEKGYEEGNH